MYQDLIEIFLFIDPLGNQCFKASQTLHDILAKREEKIVFRMVPVINSQKIRKAVRRGLFIRHGTPLDRQNRLYMNTYQAALAFNAASMQGKQKGEEFLALLQQKVVREEKLFSQDLLNQVVKHIDLDHEMFKEDFHSPLARRCFQRDQQLAAEMNIHCTPSCVILHTSDTEGAYRLDEKIEECALNYLIDLKHPINEDSIITYFDHP